MQNFDIGKKHAKFENDRKSQEMLQRTKALGELWPNPKIMSRQIDFSTTP